MWTDVVPRGFLLDKMLFMWWFVFYKDWKTKFHLTVKWRNIVPAMIARGTRPTIFLLLASCGLVHSYPEYNVSAAIQLKKNYSYTSFVSTCWPKRLVVCASTSSTQAKNSAGRSLVEEEEQKQEPSISKRKVLENISKARQNQLTQGIHGTVLGKTLEQILHANTGNDLGNVVAVTSIDHWWVFGFEFQQRETKGV